MLYSAQGTDDASLSVAVHGCLIQYPVMKMVICYTNDGGGNLQTCKNALDEVVDNLGVFTPAQPVFEQDC